nr:hypothetical protein [uncultured Lachnoanaerobaculum sp.]
MSLISSYHTDDNQGCRMAIWSVRPADMLDKIQAKNMKILILY